MDKLITITEQKGIQLVDARELHRKLQTGRDFSNWIKGRIQEYGFIENEDYFIEMEKIAQQSIIKMPPSLNVYGKEALPYIEWLLLHQYSVTSGQYHRRIKKHPEQFYRTAEGKWYINREFAEALLQLRNGYQQLTKVQGLPQVVQLELKLYEA